MAGEKWVHSLVTGREETQADELIHIHSGEKHALASFVYGIQSAFFPPSFVLLETSTYVRLFRRHQQHKVRALLAF